MKTRAILNLVALILCAVSALAQRPSTGSPVTIKDEGEFSGKRKVELAEQRITSTLVMTIKAEIDTRTKADRFRDLGTAMIRFVSTTGKREYGGAGKEFDFLVDGRRVIGGPIKSSPLRDDLNKDGKEIAAGAVNIGALDEIALGREVEMKIGEQIFTLDRSVIKNIGEFVHALVK